MTTESTGAPTRMLLGTVLLFVATAITACGYRMVGGTLGGQPDDCIARVRVASDLPEQGLELALERLVREHLTRAGGRCASGQADATLDIRLTRLERNTALRSTDSLGDSREGAWWVRLSSDVEFSRGGTCVWAAKPLTVEALVPVQAAAAGASGLSQRSVLLAEDSPLSRTYLNALLQGLRAGFSHPAPTCAASVIAVDAASESHTSEQP